MLRDQESLIDITEAIKSISRFTNGIDRSDLETNEEKLSAIIYQLAIIGEAAKRISPLFRQQHSEIPWHEMAGLRNVIVHEYDQIDFEIIWGVVETKLPELQGSIEILLPE